MTDLFTNHQRLSKPLRVLLFLSVYPMSVFQGTTASASKIFYNAKVSHAKELLGGKYSSSIVRKAELQEDLSDFIFGMTEKLLPKSYKKRAKGIAIALQLEAVQYGLDPLFLMAMIQNESGFSPERVGGAGEIGLMQIKPSTAEWIANKAQIFYRNASTLKDPIHNIKLGAALIHQLRDEFKSDPGSYVSAFNMGAGKVRSLVSKSKKPSIYVNAVMKRYIALHKAFGTYPSKSSLANYSKYNSTKDDNVAPQVDAAYRALLKSTQKSSGKELEKKPSRTLSLKDEVQTEKESLAIETNTKG